MSFTTCVSLSRRLETIQIEKANISVWKNIPVGCILFFASSLNILRAFWQKLCFIFYQIEIVNVMHIGVWTFWKEKGKILFVKHSCWMYFVFARSLNILRAFWQKLYFVFFFENVGWCDRYLKFSLFVVNEHYNFWNFSKI